jgi:hypothetical protein
MLLHSLTLRCLLLNSKREKSNNSKFTLYFTVTFTLVKNYQNSFPDLRAEAFCEFQTIQNICLESKQDTLLESYEIQYLPVATEAALYSTTFKNTTI